MHRLADPESTLDASDHQVAHHLAGDAGGRGQPGHDLAIAGIDSKQHTHDLAITTGERAMVEHASGCWAAKVQSRRRRALRPGRRPGMPF